MKKILLILFVVVVFIIFLNNPEKIKGINDPVAMRIFNEKLKVLECFTTNTKIVFNSSIDDSNGNYEVTGLAWNKPCERSTRMDYFTEETKNKDLICINFNINRSSGERADNLGHQRNCSMSWFSSSLDLGEFISPPEVNIFPVKAL